jgi:hypothetical protein
MLMRGRKVRTPCAEGLLWWVSSPTEAPLQVEGQVPWGAELDRKMPSTENVAKKLGHELQQYALISAYLYVCFGAIILYKVAILHGEGISYAPYGLAAVKALLLGKFMLMGHAIRLGDRYEKRRFIHIVAYKALLFLVALLILSVIEEAAVGVVHGRTFAASLAEVAGATLPQILASCLIMLLILIPYLTFRELDAVLGEGRLRQILFEHHAGLQSGRRHEHPQG